MLSVPVTESGRPPNTTVRPRVDKMFFTGALSSKFAIKRFLNIPPLVHDVVVRVSDL